MKRTLRVWVLCVAAVLCLVMVSGCITEAGGTVTEVKAGLALVDSDHGEITASTYWKPDVEPGDVVLIEWRYGTGSLDPGYYILEVADSEDERP